MKILKPLIIVFVFLLIQALSGVLAGLAVLLCNARSLGHLAELGTDVSGELVSEMMTPAVLGTSLIVSSIVTFLVMYLMGVVDVRSMFSVRHIRWQSSCIAIVSTIVGIFAMDVLSELLELQDNMEGMFVLLASNVWGFIAIAVVGPVGEEIVFRQALMGTMLRNNIKPLYAVIFSALCFGLVHGNPAQIPFAFVIGVLFGIIWLKTRNIVLTGILHILNNSLSATMMVVYGTEANDIRISDVVGVFPSVLLILVCSALCCYGMSVYAGGSSHK